MAAKKLSEITQGVPAQTDFLVGVTSGNLDRLFPVSDISGQIVSGVRTLLTGNTNYYVSASGSDSNPGTLAQPWATVQHAAFFIAANIDFAGFTATVNIGAGTFAGAGLASCVGGGVISFQGAGLGSTTITGGPNDGIFNFGECFTIGVNGFFNTQLTIDNLTMSNPGVGTHGVGLGIYNPAVVSLGSTGIGIHTANECIGCFAPCLIFVNNVTIPAGSYNLIFFFTIYAQAQFFGTTTFVGSPTINTVMQGEEYGFLQNFGGSFSGAITSGGVELVVFEWFSNSNFATNTFGTVSIGAGSLYLDPTSTWGNSPYQFQQNAGAGTGLANLGKEQWGVFKDYTQSTGYGNFVAHNDAGTTVYTGSIGKFTVATLPAGKPATTRAFVTDGNAPAFSGVAAGGGAVFTPVYYDGTNWRFG